MIAHKQHPAVPQQQQQAPPQQRPPPPQMHHHHHHHQQQQVVRAPPQLQHHGQQLVDQQQQYYASGDMQQSQFTSSSNSSSADHHQQLYIPQQQQHQQQMQQLSHSNHHNHHHHHVQQPPQEHYHANQQPQQVRFRQQQQQAPNPPLDHRLNGYSNGHRHNLQSQQQQTPQQQYHNTLDHQQAPHSNQVPPPPHHHANQQLQNPYHSHHHHHNHHQQQAVPPPPPPGAYEPQSQQQLVGSQAPVSYGQPEVAPQHQIQRPMGGPMRHPVVSAPAQRVSPYSSQASVRPTANQQHRGVMVSQQQYKPTTRDHHTQQQQPLPPQAQIPQQQLISPNAPQVPPPAAASYPTGQGGPHMMNGAPAAPFIEADQQHLNHHNHHQHQPQQQYPSSSPTLLQQQLNRQSGPRLGPVAANQSHSPSPLNPAQRAPNGFAGGLPQPKRGGMMPVGARYMGEPDVNLVEPTGYQPAPEVRMNSQQQQVGPVPAQGQMPLGPRPGGVQADYYPAGRAGPQQPPLTLQHHQAPQQQPPVSRPMGGHQRPMPPNPMLEHQLQQSQPQQTQLPHLLGNPTPPLTPNSNPSHLGPARTANPPIGHPVTQEGAQWTPPHNHHQHGPLTSEHGPHPPAGFDDSLSVNKQPSNNNYHHHQHPHNMNEGPSTNGQHQRTMPKNVNNNFQPQYHATNNSNNNSNNITTSHQAQPSSQMLMTQSSPNHPHHQHHQPHQHPAQIDMAPATNRNQMNVVPSAADVGGGPAPMRAQTRLTLPLRDGAPLLGPFRLDHDAQFTSKVFQIKPHLFETLGKSMSLINPQAAAVVQELQFRAYIVKSPPPNHHHHHNGNSSSSSHGDSLLASNNPTATGLHQPTKACSWPEFFRLSVNQNAIHLDRSKAAHKAVDIFQYCQLGENTLDIQVNDCYCSHEFVLEAVDRPTLKAFMNSCFKSRLLASDACIQKMKINFGTPGFLIQSQQLQQSSGIFNEYISEFVQGIEQTRTRISMRCPISARRMRTPARGYNCKHLQCFDLENFLYLNRKRSRWNCPICSLSIPFNMLELDQHQLNITQAMPETLNTDDILLDGAGQWQAYYPPPAQQQHSVLAQGAQQQQQQQMIQTTAKTNGTYHPQATMISRVGSPIPAPHHPQQPMRPMSGPIVTPTNRQQLMSGSGSPAPWDNNPHQPQHHPEVPSPPVGAGIRRPASAISQSTGRRSANGSPLTKKVYAGQYAQPNPQQQSLAAGAPPMSNGPPHGSAFFSGGGGGGTSDHHQNSFNDNTDDLSPLAAMERTIIQHEQQMGPPPFDPNSLTSSPAPQRNSTGPPSTNTTNSLISHSPSSGPNSQVPLPAAAVQIQASPGGQQQPTAFSPASHAIPSPANRLVPPPASPLQRGPMNETTLPQSPMQQLQQQQQIQTSTSISTPATPSSSMLVHGGPETPATPSNSGLQQQHCGGPNSVSAVMSHSPHIGGNNTSLMNAGQTSATGVDHQPLSNGSASAGSITSSSTMTPSGQSLGSVGMGGDSRCGTAPLQGASLGLDDLMMAGGNSMHGVQGGGSAQYGNNNNNNNKSLHGGNSPHIDESNEILMGKLLMDSSESLLRDHRNGELAMALEEVDWKQHQLDRGKSEHLANFLNEPLMKKQQQHYHHQQQQQQQQGNNKMLSGGLNPSDDEGNQSHGSSPSHNLDQLEFANYLDADGADNGAGLPPDDSILDLFER